MSIVKLATLLVLALSPLGSSIAADVIESPELIVVTGRQPGPPLWKVSKGEHVLWIFPYVNWIPQDMLWDSTRVARVLAESQEALGPPQTWWMPSQVVKLNPINIVRNKRLNRRIDRYADGGTLEANLPPELYARLAALQGRYFPETDYLREIRPARAGRWMMNVIRRREGLVDGDDILKTIQRLERRNRDLRRTEISVATVIDSYGEYEARVEAVYASYPAAEEHACFEQQLRHMEEDLDALKSRANSWAQGYIDEFRIPLAADEWNSYQCMDLWTGSSSPERETMLGMKARVDQLWLDAAESALATNASTFAVLPINELLAEDGLLSKLKAAGYEVREP